MTELYELDATAQAALVASGQITASELLEAAVARIESVEPRLNALLDRDFDAARTRTRGHLTGPFAGVPFLIKDLVAYPGLRHTFGSRLFAGNVAHEHTPYSQALDAAGLVVLGKTTTSELGLLGSTESLLAGETRNPWQETRSAGGSSGGSAAAVAAGLVPLAHASDGGGSIRIPAAMNGLFGLKPSSGRLLPSGPADMHGLLVDHVVSRSVRDSARMLAATEQRDGELKPVGFVAGPRRERLRIGVYAETLLGESPDDDARDALAQTVKLCRDLGHDVRDTSPPPIDGRDLSQAFFTAAGDVVAQLAAMVEPMLGRSPDERELEPFTLALLERQRAAPPTAVADALASFARMRATMRTYLADFDVTLCPTLPTDVPSLGTLAPTLACEELIRRTERLAGYTPIHNVAGVPAMTVPLHVVRGLPRGMHFAASHGDEAKLLALAYELEEAQPWGGRLPLVPAHWAQTSSRAAATM